MKIASLNLSTQKGVIKVPVERVTVDLQGIVGDAHAGPWHRQVSILSTDSIAKFSKQLGRNIRYGEFAENITIEGLGGTRVGVLDRFFSNGVVLEVTQLGKSCHGDGCSIFREVGNCVMPKEGIFCRVIQGGELFTGDKVDFQPKVFKILVITLSDRCYAGIGEDRSGPLVRNQLSELMESHKRKYSIETGILPDEPMQVAKRISSAFHEGYDIIVTTGSTGIGPRDIAPEAIRPLLDREIPGIMDMIRLKYGMEKPNALISRAFAGTKNKSLFFAIPGSPKAVIEYMEEIKKIIFHCFNMLYSIDNH
ncbi:MAG: molybdenum cofactor synthesis domain-containing protein [Bacteroidales bacterium]|nr:molybdopterin-binding protein [Bacteroidales bacterium]HPO66596.1 molybdopterin-binding protein [Bacteroidales bacterium]